MKTLKQIRESFLKEGIVADEDRQLAPGTVSTGPMNGSGPIDVDEAEDAPKSGDEQRLDTLQKKYASLTRQYNNTDDFYRKDDLKTQRLELRSQLADLRVKMDKAKKNESVVNEVLSKSDPVEKWISDFVASSDERFADKSKDERIKMALGAYYAAQKNEGSGESLEGPTGPVVSPEAGPNTSSDVVKEGGDEEIGPGTQLRTNRGVWCVVDEIDQKNSNYAWCTDEDGGDVHVNLNMADVVRTGPPRHDREDQDTSMYEAIDPKKKKKNLQSSISYLKSRIKIEKNAEKLNDYKADLRRFQSMLDQIKEAMEDNNDEAEEAEEISIARHELDRMADMADDLFYFFETTNEIPPWIQDKISSIHAELRDVYGYVMRVTGPAAPQSDDVDFTPES